MKKTDLQKVVSDKSRKVTIRGRQAIVAEKFDKHGDVLNENTPAEDYVLHNCPLDHIEFLAYWQEANYLEDPVKMAEKAGVSEDRAKLLIKKLQWMKREESKVKALSNIITPEKILVRQWENSYTNTLDDGQRDSLKEAAKIVGAYKQTVVSQTNIFNMPTLSPEEEAALKAIGDSIAMKKNAVTVEAIRAA